MLSFAAELRMCNSTKAERRERVLTVLRRLHLADDEIRTRIGSVDERGLSGGQRKRVSIGLELIGSPRVLLVDEPTSGLDAKMALSVIQLLRERTDCVAAELHVKAENAGAMSFYKRFGFEIDPEHGFSRDHYYIEGHNYHAFYMRYSFVPRRNRWCTLL